MDGIPGNSNNPQSQGPEPSSHDLIPLSKSLDQKLPSSDQLKKMRQEFRERLHRIERSQDISNVRLIPAARENTLDWDADLRKETISVLQRLSNPELDKELKDGLRLSFLENGFFQEPENAQKLSSFFNAILYQGEDSFFSENNIDKKEFVKFLFKAKTIEPKLLTDLVLRESGAKAYANFIKLVDQAKLSKKQIATLLIKNLLQVKDYLSDDEISNLTNNMDKFLDNKKSRFTQVLRSIIDAAQKRTDKSLVGIVKEGVDVSFYQEQININMETETSDFMFDSKDDVLDDPEALINRSHTRLGNLVESYHKQKRSLDGSHRLLRAVLKQEPERTNVHDLVSMLDYFKVDIKSLERLQSSELEDLSVFSNFGINLFGQKDFSDFVDTMNLIDQIPPDSKKVNSEDKFKLLSDLHFEMNDEPFLNTRFQLVLAETLREIDSKQTSQYFLDMLDDFSPYGFSYDNFQHMAEHLANDSDPKIQKAVLQRLLEEYEIQLKQSPKARSLPLLLTFVDHALSNADISVDANGNKSLMEPRKKSPIFAKFLQNGNVDFDVMMPMLEAAWENFKMTEEENYSLISRQMTDFSSLGFDGDYDDSELLLNQDQALLLQKSVEAISYQTSRKQEPKEDIIGIKLFQYLYGLSQTDPARIDSFRGPAKHFVDIQKSLAGKDDN